MIKEFQPLYDSIHKAVNEHFVSALNTRLEEQKSFISNIENIFTKYLVLVENSKGDKNKLLLVLQEFHSEILPVLENKHTGYSTLSFDEEYNEFVEKLTSLFLSQEEKRIIFQSEDRFKKYPDEILIVSFYKFHKSILRNIYNLPVRFRNFFFSRLKREVKPIHNWRQVVPLKNLTIFYFRDELSELLLKLITDVNKMKAETYYKSWMLSKEFDNKVSLLLNKNNSDEPFRFDVKSSTDNCYNQIENVGNFIADESFRLFNKVIEEFESAYNKAGTIELPKLYFSDSVVEKKHKSLNTQYSGMNERWGNSFFTLFDQWRLYEELYIQKYYCFDEYEKTLNESDKKVNSTIAGCINDIISTLKTSKKVIEDNYNSPDNFKSVLVNEKAFLKERLSESLLPLSIEKIIDQNLSQLVNELDENLRHKVSTLSSKRSIIKGTNYAREVKQSEIESFSPVTLVKTVLLNSYFVESRSIKAAIIDSLSNMQKNMDELDQIAEFNLDAAIASLEYKKSSIEEARKVAVEGFDRAIAKSNDVYKYIEMINNIFILELKSAIDKYIIGLTGLTETEKVLQLKFRIATAKTTEKAKWVKQKVFNQLKETYPRLTSLVEKLKKEYSLYDRLLRKKIGLDTPVRKISSEISDYLSETQSAIERLPYVYQRLFRTEALTDERFFEGREKEIEYISSAYQNWLKGRFTPVVVHGEKGNGATTLINFALKTINPYSFVYRTSITHTIYKKDEFLSLLIKLLNAPDLKDFDELANWLNNLDSRQIIVIENLQNLFLRTVNGFKTLQTLFELISRTNKNIFWVTTCTLYSWEYLSKTINIQDYFSYEIPLDILDDKQIINIIMKRHRVSGYDLHFLPSDIDIKQPSFRKMSEEEQQQALKEKYFSKLNKIIRSNISLAQLFWLRSISNLKENKIFVASLEELDFSFLKSLQDNKIFTLAGLLIHEGLSLNDISLVFGQSDASSKSILISLVDDGIVFNDHGYYKVNPLLYRQTVNLLISKNILH